MNTALTTSMTKLPEQLRKTLTWDRGKELSGHAQFALDTGTKVFFADPHSPWQRPTNENTNGLLRQYFPKGTDLSRWPAEDLEAVARRSTTGPARSSAGGHRPRSSRNSYAHYNSPVLQQPVELAQYTSTEFAQSLDQLGLRRSAGRTGICFDNAMAESFFGSLKNERVSRVTYLTR